MLAALAAAAAVAASSPPPAVAQPTTVHLEVTPTELAIIADALTDKPYRVSRPVIDDLRAQLERQATVAPAAPASAKATP